MHVRQPRFGIALLQLVRYGVHEMRLPQADSAVNEKRVVGLARIPRHLNRRRLGKLIALSLDETVKRKSRIDRRPQHRGCEPARSRSRTDAMFLAPPDQ